MSRAFSRLIRGRALSLSVYLVLAGAVAVAGWSQTANLQMPSKTDCTQWDRAYAQLVVNSMIGVAIGAAVAALFVGVVFGRQLWWAARPRPRIWLATFAFAFPLAEFLIVGLPRLGGFGRFFFSAIDARYPQCSTIPFGAEGLLRGLIGNGVAAFAQWQVITALLLAGSAVGGFAAFLISEAIVRSSGLEAIARKGDL